VALYITPQLDLNEIQGDLLIGMQKNAETFLFFKIVNAPLFQTILRQYVITRIVNAQQVNQREMVIENQHRLSRNHAESFQAINLGLTKDGLDQLLGAGRPPLETAFERGAADPATISALHDPPPSTWRPAFISDRIDGVFLVAARSRSAAAYHANELLRCLGGSVKVLYSEMGQVRPGKERGHEHFGFLDGISQPGIRGVTRPSQPFYRPNQGLPGQELVWPGEFVFGYPGQNPKDLGKPGEPPDMAAPWMKNGSFMVFRRLEQKVPEFRKFVAEQAARFGMDQELLAARMVGRWKSGAPLELAPLRDNPALGADENRNNDFDYRDDPFQRRCPYAAHIRKVYPRDDTGSLAEVQRHRIIRAGIPFGPQGRAPRDGDEAKPRTNVRMLSDLDRAPVRIHPAP
jgi:Dyp-type peroxidase family